MNSSLQKYFLNSIIIYVTGILSLPGSIQLEKAIPDDFLIVGKLNNIEKISQINNDNSLFEFFKSEEISKFFHPLIEKSANGNLLEDLENELDLKSEQLIKLFPGQIVFAFNSSNAETLNDSNFHSIILVEYKGDKKTFIELIESSAKYDSKKEGFKHSIIHDEYLGVPVYIEEVKYDDELKTAGGYALIDGIAIVVDDKNLLYNIVARFKNNLSETSIMDLKSFKEMKIQNPDSDVYIYLNIEPLVQIINSELNQNNNKSPNPLGITPDSMIKALSLDSIKSLYVSLDFKNIEPEINFRLNYQEKRGLSSLFTYKTGDVPKPAFIPEDVAVVSVSLFSVTEFWNNLEKIIYNMSPIWGGMFTGQIEQLKHINGIDIREGLINNFLDKVVSYQMFSKNHNDENELDQPNQIMALSIKDKQGLEFVFETLKNIISERTGKEFFENHKYLEHTIYTLRNHQQQSSNINSFSYTVTDDYLISCFGETKFLEHCISRINKTDHSIWENLDINDALNKFPKESSGFAYYDVGVFLNLAFTSIVNIQNKSLLRKSKFLFCDPSALPTPNNIPYFIMASLIADDNGLFTKALLFKKSEK